MLREHWGHRGCAVTALRGLQGLLCSCHQSRGHSLSCHLRKVWSCISKQLSPHTPQRKVSFCLWWAGKGKKSAGQVVGVQEIWALQWGQAEERACLGLHTSSSEIPAFPNCQGKEQQQVLSRTPVLPWCTGILQLRPWNIHLGAVAASGWHLSARSRAPGSRDSNAEKGVCVSRWLSHHQTMGIQSVPSPALFPSANKHPPHNSQDRKHTSLYFWYLGFICRAGCWGLSLSITYKERINCGGL